MEEKLLEGKFFLFPSCSHRYEVIVTRQNLMFWQIRERDPMKSELSSSPTTSTMPQKMQSILMENIIGCRMYESKVQRDVYCCFHVVALIKNKKGMRHKQVYTFCVLESGDKQENITIAETWARTISWLARDPTLSSIELEEKEHFPPQRRFFVMINPKSGKGQSVQLFSNVIEPMLKDAMISYEVLITERPGHCRSISKRFDHTQYDAIVICSGDGLAYEYINGLMQRSDWKDALQVPIGILPTGSGNALCASLCYAVKEEFSLINCVFILLKGQSHPMDLFSLENRKGTVYGFLSVTWGLLSDVDIESEKFRALGVLRFTVGGLQRILSMRHYEGTFSYLPATPAVNQVENNAINTENGRRHTYFETTRSETRNGQDVRHEHTANSSIQHANESENNSSDVGTEEHKEKSNIRNCETNGDSSITSKSYGPKSSLPHINEPLGEDWCEIRGEYVLLGLCSLSHLGSDMHSSPGTFFNDGLLDAQYVMKGTKKKTMLDMMGAFETGTHVSFPDLRRVSIKAFRLSPGWSQERKGQGHVAIDGEEIEYGLIQGEIFQSLANIILLKR